MRQPPGRPPQASRPRLTERLTVAPQGKEWDSKKGEWIQGTGEPKSNKTKPESSKPRGRPPKRQRDSADLADPWFCVHCDFNHPSLSIVTAHEQSCKRASVKSVQAFKANKSKKTSLNANDDKEVSCIIIIIERSLGGSVPRLRPLSSVWAWGSSI